jgi:hypothetical protein
VQPADPDPLVNTVTATYNNGSDFGDTDISDFDDHEVNLFQPSITLEKTGDTLSKIGVKVDYTIALTNTSSGDTPHPRPGLHRLRPHAGGEQERHPVLGPERRDRGHRLHDPR